MYARTLAMCCLLPLSIASGASLPRVRKDVVVYLKSAADLSPAVLEEAKAELASIMQAAGTRVAWWEADPAQTSVDGAFIVADFVGSCRVPVSAAEIADVRSLPPLAHTSTADGRILPFTYVDCGTLSEFVSAALTRVPTANREQLYGRAIGRLLAHEIYHILGQTRDHAAAGVAKMHFSAADLLAPRFEFEPATSAHLWRGGASPKARTLVEF